jgi:hypothetical protein
MPLPLAAVGQDAYAPVESRLRKQSKPVGLGPQRLSRGLGIAPLRATSSPVLVTGSQAARPAGSLLVEPPPAGRQVIDMLRGSARDSSVLPAALGSGARGTTSLGVLQARLSRARSQFGALDGKSRFLLADRGDARSNAWFKAPLAQVKFDLTG